eukprot:TRINITY_DN100880_c0_g1_i1.p1 TRINITY_DN100880_c0_g1~~TRINITY_DN100880_c0_g1_i1.p1  ORF type:complete len:480 (+),score=108.32 TRINITY_DN100880_c0_g1_i1:168-1607(+)
MDIETRLHRRLLVASVASAGATAAAVLPFSLVLPSVSPTPGSLLSGVVLLGPAHLLRVAAVLQRTAGVRPPGLRSCAVGLLAVLLTALACGVFLGGLTDEDVTTSRTFSGLIGCACLLHMAERRVVDWSPSRLAALHLRLKADLQAAALRIGGFTLSTVLAAAFVDGSGFFSTLCLARLATAAMMLIAQELLSQGVAESMQLTLRDLPTASELAQALSQPLSVQGPGLGRWLALTTLSQAASLRPQRAHLGMPMGIDKAASAIALPPLLAEVFGRSVGAWSASAAGVSPAPAADFATVGSGGVNILGAGSTKLPPAGTGASFFALFLRSALEVLRELTVRAQSLQAAARSRGPDALHPAQVAILDAQVVELSALARVAVVGVAGWTCLSRDYDEVGVVQREAALDKILYELCGVLCALEKLWPLRGTLFLSPCAAQALEKVQEDARRSLKEIVLTFEDAGLRRVTLPPLYKLLINRLFA